MVAAIITACLLIFLSPVSCWRFSNIRYKRNAWNGGKNAVEFNLYRTRNLCSGDTSGRGKGAGRVGRCVDREMPAPVTCAWGIYPERYDENETWHTCSKSHLAPDGEVDIPEWGQQFLKWRVKSVHEHNLNNSVDPNATPFTNVTIEVVQAVPKISNNPVNGHREFDWFDVYVANVTLDIAAADCRVDSTTEGKIDYSCEMKSNDPRPDYRYRCGTKPPNAWLDDEGYLGVECNSTIPVPKATNFVKYSTFVTQYWEPIIAWAKDQQGIQSLLEGK